LDEDEFAELDLDVDTQHQARAALGELKRVFRETEILKQGLALGIE